MKKEFTKQVQNIVASIPRGVVMSYKEVAKKTDTPRAYRAVGSIMAKNKDPAIPCHRVVRSDRIIGRYNRGGTEKKKQLLEEEGIEIKMTRKGYKII